MLTRRMEIVERLKQLLTDWRKDEEFEKFDSLSGRVAQRPLPPGTGGPLGLGDPADMALHMLEEEEVLPQRVLDTARNVHCAALQREWDQCCDQGMMATMFTCDSEPLRACLQEQFYSKELRAAVRSEYLLERSHYRQTGLRTRRYLHGKMLPRPAEQGPGLDPATGLYVPRKPDLWDSAYPEGPPSWAAQAENTCPS